MLAIKSLTWFAPAGLLSHAAVITAAERISQIMTSAVMQISFHIKMDSLESCFGFFRRPSETHMHAGGPTASPLLSGRN